MLHIFHVDMLWDRGIPTSNLESGSQLIGLMESLAETRIFRMVGFSQVRFVGNPHFFAAWKKAPGLDLLGMKYGTQVYQWGLLR